MSAVATTPAANHHRRPGRRPIQSESRESGSARKSDSSHTPAFTDAAMPDIHGIGDAIWFGSSSSSLGTHQPNSVRVTR
jgi:hypothetical protein